MANNLTINYDEMTDYDEYLCEPDFPATMGPAIMGSAFICIFIISVIGNGLVLCVLFMHYQQKSVTNIFMLNLACSDLIFTVTLPFWATYYYLHHWVFGDFVCKFMTAAYFVGLYSSAILLTAMTVDRFTAVVLPLRRHGCPVRTCAVGACIAAWVISISASLRDAIKAKVVNGDDVNYCVDESDDNLGYYLQISMVFFPLAIIIFLSSAMLKKVLLSRNSLKGKLTIMTLCVVAVFFICWGPHHILFIIRSLYTPKGCKAQQQLNIALCICELLANSHCCMNPLLYIWSQNSRKHLLNLLRCENVCRKNRERDTGQNALFNQNVAFTAQRPEDGTAL